MKEWMAKIRGTKTGPVLAVLGLCILSWLLLPAGEKSQPFTQEEQRISQALSLIAGVGECRLLLYYQGEDSPFGAEAALSGAVIIAQGAEDIIVRLHLLQAAETLLGLPPERVEIFPMEDGP